MRFAIIVSIMVLLFCSPVVLASQDHWEEQPLPLEDWLFELDREFSDHVPQLNWSQLFSDLVKGRTTLDFRSLGLDLFKHFTGEFWALSRLLAQLLVLIVACSLLQNVHTALARSGSGQLAYLVCYLALIGVAMGSFTAAMGIARGVIESLVTFLQALLPVMVTLLATSGAPASAGMLHPVMTLAIYGVSVLIADFVFPLIFVAAVIELVGHLSEKFDISGMVTLLKQVALGAMGLAMTAFCGIIVVQRAASGVADSVSLRTAKYLAGTFVPIIGKLFADTMEMVYVSSASLRSVVGIAGSFGVFVMVAFPLVKIVSLIAVYRIAAALAQPVGGERVSKCLHSIASFLTIGAVCVGAVALMFIFALAMMASASRPF